MIFEAVNFNSITLGLSHQRFGLLIGIKRLLLFILLCLIFARS